MFTSFNNAAQSTKMSSNASKRSSLLRGLFGRHTLKKRVSIVKQPLKTSQCTNKKRIISGGDHVKLSFTRLSHMEQPYQSKYYYNDTIDNRKTTNNTCQLSFQGLRYDFKPIKSTSTTNPSSKNSY